MEDSDADEADVNQQEEEDEEGEAEGGGAREAADRIGMVRFAPACLFACMPAGVNVSLPLSALLRCMPP